MFGLFNSNKNRNVLTAPSRGVVHDLSEGKDQVFADEIMGPGCFIVPDEEGKVYSPCDGIVSVVFPTLHAYGLTSNSGVEIVIHIGVDTVELNGELFESHVKKDQVVKKGDLLASFNLKEMIDRKIIPDIFIVFPNKKGEKMTINFGKVKVGDKLVEF